MMGRAAGGIPAVAGGRTGSRRYGRVSATLGNRGWGNAQARSRRDPGARRRPGRGRGPERSVRGPAGPAGPEAGRLRALAPGTCIPDSDPHFHKAARLKGLPFQGLPFCRAAFREPLKGKEGRPESVRGPTRISFGPVRQGACPGSDGGARAGAGACRREYQARVYDARRRVGTCWPHLARGGRRGESRFG